jgi:uncharacterized membrane protein
MRNSEKSRAAVIAAVTSLIAVGVMAPSARADESHYEKCAGIVVAGKNDCGTPVSSCAGTVKEDRDPYGWIYLPAGTCSKIVGGIVTKDPMNRHGGAAGDK